MADSTQDARFRSIHNDPRFIKQNKKTQNREQKDPDDRFKSLNQKSSFKKSQIPKLVDYARGRVVLESSDEEEDDDEENGGSDSNSDSESVVQLGPGASSSKGENIPPEIDLDEDVVEEEQEPTVNQIEPTKRIGIVNLDWDNVKPIDIYKVFSSLLSPNHQEQPKNSSSLGNKPTLKDDTVSIIKGHVVRVRFYKSQFGKERMKIEDIQGPPKEIFKKPTGTQNELKSDKDDDDDSDDEWMNNDENGFDEEALRKYQLDRLRYFYAIVQLDSVRTAHHVFTQIDGTEFERTANIFDLSYVPDDMNFDEEDLWDECDEDSNDYKGVDFSTDVLRHSKVKLTWDTEDPIRTKYTRLNTQKIKQEDLDSMDFKSFLAPPSSEEGSESESEQERREALRNNDSSNPSRSKNLRQLLGLVEDSTSFLTAEHHPGSSSKDLEDDLDITFKPGFINLRLDQTNDQKTTSKNQRIKQKLKSKDTFDDQSILLNQQDSKEYQDKLSSKKKNKDKDKDKKDAKTEKDPSETQNRQELELLMMQDMEKTSNSTENKQHFDLNQIIKSEKNKNKKNKKKNKHKKSKDDGNGDGEEGFVDNFSIDPADQRFGNLLVNHPEFAIDPSNPQFKKTKNMMDLLNSTGEKRRAKDQDDTRDDRPQPITSNKPTLDHTRVLLNQLKKNSSSSFKRPKLI